MPMSIFKFLDVRKLVFAVLFLVLLLLLQLSDPDYYWHLKTGEYIVTQGSLPRTDIFSYTHHGDPWVLHEWLFQVVLYVVYHSLGHFGIKLLTVFLGVLALYIAYAAANRILRGSVLALYLTLVFSAGFVPFFHPRPQLFTYAFFAAFLHLLVTFKYFHGGRSLLFLPPALMALWVNLHGGYVVGIGLMAFFTFSEFISYWAKGGGDGEHWRRITRLALSTALTALASVLNPDLAAHWLYPLKVLLMEASRTFITEWGSPNFLFWDSRWYLLTVMGFFAACIYRNAKPDLTEFAVPVFFIVAGFFSLRHIPLATLTMIPFTGAALAQGLDDDVRALWARSPLRRLYGKLAGENKELTKTTEYVVNWVILGVACLAIFSYYPVREAVAREELNSELPIKATEFIAQAGIKGHMFNTYHFGGYLIYRLYPGQRVFIDGRADMYGDSFVQEYLETYSAKPGWKDTFDKYSIDYVVCERKAPIRQLLLARGDFKLVYDDGVNSVLVKDQPQFADIISRYAQ